MARGIHLTHFYEYLNGSGLLRVGAESSFGQKVGLGFGHQVEGDEKVYTARLFLDN